MGNFASQSVKVVMDEGSGSDAIPAEMKAATSSGRARWWVMAGVGVLLIAAVAGILATRSSPSPTNAKGVVATAPGQPAVGTGYLANESDGVIFLQWTNTDNDLSGTAQVEVLGGSPPNQSISTHTVSVTGQLNGSTITLSFEGGTQVFGTLSGGSFTVNFPQQDGSLAPVTFHSASAAEFNQALAALQGTTGSVNNQAAAAETVTSQQQSIDRSASRVSGDISSLSSDSSQLSGTLDSYAKDLSQAQSDLASEAKLEGQVIAEANAGTGQDQVCTDSDTVASDEDTVASDGDSVSSDADSTESDLNTVRTDISNLQGDFSALQSAQAQRPSYSDGAPSQDQVNQAVAAAREGHQRCPRCC